MTWNLAFAYGKGSAGDNYHYRPKEEFIRRLDAMASIIREEAVDLAFLQEVDFRCGRSHGIDEMKFLAERTGLPYAAPAISWRVPYLPYPYWPPRDHFGRMLSGGAILSRFPISENEVHLLPKPREFPWWYRMFYPHRFFQTAQVMIDDTRFQVINLHLEAFVPSNRMQQARMVTDWIRKNGSAPLLSVGGDFNSILPGAEPRKNFKDEPRLDYGGETTLEAFLEVPEIGEVGADARLTGGSFPAELPTRRLDHIFVNRKCTIRAAKIIPTTNLSDHLPVVAAIQLQSHRN